MLRHYVKLKRRIILTISQISKIICDINFALSRFDFIRMIDENFRMAGIKIDK